MNPQRTFPSHDRCLFSRNRAQQTQSIQEALAQNTRTPAGRLQPLSGNWLTCISMSPLAMPQHTFPLWKFCQLNLCGSYLIPFQATRFLFFHWETYLQDFPNPHCCSFLMSWILLRVLTEKQGSFKMLSVYTLWPLTVPLPQDPDSEPAALTEGGDTLSPLPAPIAVFSLPSHGNLFRCFQCLYYAWIRC